MLENLKYHFAQAVRREGAAVLLALSGAIGSGFLVADIQNEDPSSIGGPKQQEAVEVFEGHIKSLSSQYSKYSGFDAVISSAQLLDNQEQVGTLTKEQTATYQEMMRQAKSFDQELYMNTSMSEVDAQNLAEDFNNVFVLQEHQIDTNIAPYIHEAQLEHIKNHSEDRVASANSVRQSAKEKHKADLADNAGEEIFFGVVGGALIFGVFGGIAGGSSRVREWGYNKPTKKPGLFETWKNRPKAQKN